MVSYPCTYPLSFISFYFLFLSILRLYLHEFFSFLFIFQCDGVRPPYQPVLKLSQFDTSKSIQDQQFLYSVKNNISTTQVNNSMSPDQQMSVSPFFLSLFYLANSAQERYLVQSALRRRIWLSLGGEDSSRHEQFSDTIFWCVDLIFTKQLEDGTASQYSYRVQNIPETIRVETVLRQFLKPRQHGCIVSKSDLDMEKMAPFIEAGIESVNGFMLVPDMEYYGINFGKDFLHNMRNRVIVNHPRIIITLNTEFISSHQVGCLIPSYALNHSLCPVALILMFVFFFEGSDRCAMRRGRGGFRSGFRAGQGGPRLKFRRGSRDRGDGRRDHGTQRGNSRDRFKVFHQNSFLVSVVFVHHFFFAGSL
ncbi:unnamed protein product [Angiostrongylus costaricensis]|uniref:EAL domain-containing protein n=1 Tax=Angiostrongylus costaricensis TaxID=334426 RepID=A0A0R3PRH4_ANGCS|nr:unnamed protein product [Angiostrongylus costaricensis]